MMTKIMTLESSYHLQMSLEHKEKRSICYKWGGELSLMKLVVERSCPKNDAQHRLGSVLGRERPGN